MKTARFALVFAASLVLPKVAWSVCTPTVQWVWDGNTESPSHPHQCDNPLVVQLTDDDGDGDIDGDDIPDIIFTHHEIPRGVDTILTVLDGATGTEHFSISDPVYLLFALFIPGSAAPPAPFPLPGNDPTFRDNLGCAD